MAPPKKKVQKRTFVKADATLKITECPQCFAPTAERLIMKLDLKREGKSEGKMGHLIIEDRKGAVLHKYTALGLGGDGPMKYEWDGKDDAGKYPGPLQSPLRVMVVMSNNANIKDVKIVRIEIKEIDLWVDAPKSKIFMNDPARKVNVVSTVRIKKSDGSATVVALPIDVKYTFTVPPPGNTSQANSFKYATGPDKYLGKKDDVNAIFWESPPAITASSTDGYKTNCKIGTITASGADRGKAKVFFLPSALGGDKYKLRAAVLAADGTTELSFKETDTLTVWRWVTFSNIYEMNGENHVSRNAATANISPLYNPAFVEYKAGAATAIDATHSVKYIGLWKDSSTPQESWATMQAKKPDETPTAAEIANAMYSGADPVKIALIPAARGAIKAKAQKWASRIDNAFHAALGKWVTDAGIPNNTLVAIKHYHPKYSPDGGDSVTNEWDLDGNGVPNWLTVDVFPKTGGGHYYTNLNPDGEWVYWTGLSHGNGVVTIPTGRPDAAVKQTISHEAGHATRSFFRREEFGPSMDHSASQAGIMYFSTDGGTTFTAREKKILRGIVP